MPNNAPSEVTLRPGLIPGCIRENIALTLYRRFMEEIRDPEKLRQYNELGRAFMERQAEEGGNT